MTGEAAFSNGAAIATLCNRRSPPPLVGEGQGGGALPNMHSNPPTPSPSPQGGRGAALPAACLK